MEESMQQVLVDRYILSTESKRQAIKGARSKYVTSEKAQMVGKDGRKRRRATQDEHIRAGYQKRICLALEEVRKGKGCKAEEILKAAILQESRFNQSLFGQNGAPIRIPKSEIFDTIAQRWGKDIIQDVPSLFDFKFVDATSIFASKASCKGGGKFNDQTFSDFVKRSINNDFKDCSTLIWAIDKPSFVSTFDQLVILILIL